MISNRRALENYAQNVLRPNLCKARSQQVYHLFYVTLFGLSAWVCILAAWAFTDGFVCLVLYFIAFIVSLPTCIYSPRLEYWQRTEKNIRARLDQVMDELIEPGEPSKGPEDFALPIETSAFDAKFFSLGLLSLFKAEPELVFPSPSPSASDIV